MVNMWELGCDMAAQVYNCWRVTARVCWWVPRNTHCHFVDNVLTTGFTSIKCDILSRYSNFYRGLLTFPSSEVMFIAVLVAGDLTTTTGRRARWTLSSPPISD
jgi:hypothetical protein